MDHQADGAAPDRRRFEELYEAHYAAVARYALRRTDSTDDAVDAIGETFLILWRRLDDAPSGDDTLLWLYGVARRVLANQYRGAARRELLSARLRDELAHSAEPAPDGAAPPEGIRAAFARLPADDRELLSLTGWEGLTPGQVAKVVGKAPGAVRVHLHRARKRFARELAREGVDVGRYGVRAAAMAEGAL